MKSTKVIYWVATGLLCLLLLASVANYTLNHAAVAQLFPQLGYPAYLVYPLAAAKLLAVVALLTNRSAVLREWAYAAVFFNVLLAFAAHTTTGVPGAPFPVLAMILLLTSRALVNKVRPSALTPQAGQLQSAF